MRRPIVARSALESDALSASRRSKLAGGSSQKRSGAASPIEPVGDALTAGVGPGSWAALRPDHVDVDFEGAARIVPLATLPDYGVSDRDPDPRGMAVRDVHGDVAGTVVDLWLDRADMLFRYLEIEVPLTSSVSLERTDFFISVSRQFCIVILSVH